MRWLLIFIILLLAACSADVEELEEVPGEPGTAEEPEEQPQEEPEAAVEEPELRVVTSRERIVLQGNETLEITNTHFIHENDILLRDNAVLIVRDSLLELNEDFAFQHQLEAKDSSRVVFENSELQTSCAGSLNWNFFDQSRFEAANISMPGCNTWNFFADNASAEIVNWDFFGGTVCGSARVSIDRSGEMEIELCYGSGTVVDEELPRKITEFTFPNENEKNISSSLHITNSTVAGWGINVQPRSDITIRNAPAITVSVIVGLPWEGKTVELEDLGSRHYELQHWQIADADLTLINATTYGWEPNAFNDNILIIRNSYYSGSSINSGDARYVIINSTLDLVRAQERVEMTLRDSLVRGDVIATGNSVIKLVNTEVTGRIIGEDSGQVFVDGEDAVDSALS